MELKGRSIIEILAEADIVVQLVSLMLLIASIWSWSIIINKVMYFRLVRKHGERLDKMLRSGMDWQTILDSVREGVVVPMEYIFYKTFSEIKACGGPEHIDVKPVHEREQLRANLELMAVSAKEKFVNEWDNDLSYLATISSVSPFVGLFGTVWGIMRSFQAIATAKNTSLAIVAPGIAEALFATALGLVAAIPALIFYNILLNKIGVVEREMDELLVRMNVRVKKLLKL